MNESQIIDPTEPPSTSLPNSNTTSSSTLSSHRFNISPTSHSPILVYKLRSGYTITTESALAHDLDAEPSRWRCSRKPIGRGMSRLHIQVRDTLVEPERSLAEGMPNQTNSVASLGLPTGVWWRRMLLGQFKELYIVSPESSSSVGTSSGESQMLDGSGQSSPEDELARSQSWTRREAGG